MFCYLCDKLDLIALNVSDDQDLHLGKEVKGEIIDSITQDRLLDEQNVATSLLDLLAHVQDVVTLLFQHAVHLLVVGNDDTVVHLKAHVRTPNHHQF